MIHIGPEPHWQGSGSFTLRGGGESPKLAVVVLGVHTTSKNPHPISDVQAYIAYLHGRRTVENLARSGLENDRRNGCRNASETVVL